MEAAITGTWGKDCRSDRTSWRISFNSCSGGSGKWFRSIESILLPGLANGSSFRWLCKISRKGTEINYASDQLIKRKLLNSGSKAFALAATSFLVGSCCSNAK